jgi:exonuclease VII large subunit
LEYLSNALPANERRDFLQRIAELEKKSRVLPGADQTLVRKLRQELMAKEAEIKRLMKRIGVLESDKVLVKADLVTPAPTQEVDNKHRTDQANRQLEIHRLKEDNARLTQALTFAQSQLLAEKKRRTADAARRHRELKNEPLVTEVEWQSKLATVDDVGEI